TKRLQIRQFYHARVSVARARNGIADHKGCSSLPCHCDKASKGRDGTTLGTKRRSVSTLKVEALRDSRFGPFKPGNSVLSEYVEHVIKARVLLGGIRRIRIE